MNGSSLLLAMRGPVLLVTLGLLMAADQLDRIAGLKETHLDQAIVLDPAPVMSLDLYLRHSVRLAIR